MPLESQRLAPEEYKRNFADLHPPFELFDTAFIEANRCLYCYDAPCTKSCPTSIDVPQFIKQISTGNIKGSAETIFSANIMGGGCAKVCPVEKLCEGACVYNLLHEEPIAIAKLQRFSTEKAIKEQWKIFERKPSNGKRVAIVGAGPAGLACAHALSLEGVDVTIFEKEAKGGGLMTYGVAAYKVTPEFCEEEVDWILSVGGITVQYNTEIGTAKTLQDLQRDYDAVFVGIGVGVARHLGIPGEELDGVVDAIKFIYDIRTKDYSEIPVGNRVAVIGMGMTAIDAATQSKRLGAKEVVMVYRRDEIEKSCTDAELNIAKLDGCSFVWLAAPKEILGEHGKATALVCDVVRLSDEADSSGKRAILPTGETVTIEADMIIRAAGQIPFEEFVQGAQIQNQSGRIVTNGLQTTNLKGVFAGGDCVNGGKEVVDAVQHGKDAAKGILEYLFPDGIK
jgi:glutamate synthase (NADPH/NADH) small chain